MLCDICDWDPCKRPSFCRACRIADRAKRLGLPPRYDRPIGEYDASALKSVLMSRLPPLQKARALHSDFLKYQRLDDDSDNEGP
jgi:hypothetical protein